MVRVIEQLLRRTDLDDLTLVHDGDHIAHLGCDVEVVGNEQHRELQTGLQLLQQIEHLLLY